MGLWVRVNACVRTRECVGVCVGVCACACACVCVCVCVCECARGCVRVCCVSYTSITVEKVVFVVIWGFDITTQITSVPSSVFFAYLDITIFYPNSSHFYVLTFSSLS